MDHDEVPADASFASSCESDLEYHDAIEDNMEDAPTPTPHKTQKKTATKKKYCDIIS